MNKMLKKAVSLAAAVSVTASLALPASAAGILSVIEKIAENSQLDDVISIVCNDSLIDSTDAKNIDGRVMLPFRAVLEGMGATVDYDNDTHTVTASRNGTQIHFTVGDNTIYISKDGTDTTEKSDVAPFIENDRTFVPVRFISQALGMQVGWDDGTVLIVDNDKYHDEITESEAALDKLFEKAPKTSYGAKTENLELVYVAAADDAEKTATLNTEFTLNRGDGVIALNGTVTADLSQLIPMMPTLENEDFGLILTEEKIYVNTAKGTALADAVKTASFGMLTSDWVSVDASTLFEKLDNAFLGIDTYKNLFKTNTEKTEVFDDIIKSDGDATLASLFFSELVTKAYGLIADYVTVTDDSVSIKLDGGFVRALTQKLGETPVAAGNLLDMIDFNLDSTTKYTDDSRVTDTSLGFGVNIFDTQRTMQLKINETAQTGDVSAPEIPENAVDVTSLLK